MGEEIIKIPFINNSGKYVGVGEKVQIIHNDDSEVILMVLWKVGSTGMIGGF